MVAVMLRSLPESSYWLHSTTDHENTIFISIEQIKNAGTIETKSKQTTAIHLKSQRKRKNKWQSWDVN